MPIRPTCELTRAEAHPGLAWAADLATESGQPVAFLGLYGPLNQPKYCRGRCVADHAGSVLVIPDVVMIEMQANGWAEAKTEMLTRPDGAAVWLYKVCGH